jgi:putative FmdB family regulatory protein
MPIYEYACGGCGREFEIEQRITEDPVKTCPRCRSRKVKRLISQTSFVLKGGGWYADLYSSSSGKAKPGESASDGSKETSLDSGSGSGTQSETKSDSETKPDSSATTSKKKGKKGVKAAAA